MEGAPRASLPPWRPEWNAQSRGDEALGRSRPSSPNFTVKFGLADVEEQGVVSETPIPGSDEELAKLVMHELCRLALGPGDKRTRSWRSPPCSSTNASYENEFEAAFAFAARERVGGLVVGGDSLFSSRTDLLVAQAIRHAMPAIYARREEAAAGGLMSYGLDTVDAFRRAGIFTGRILKGEEPAELPVQLATKIQLVLNLKTARAIGLTFPLTLLGRADEVIE
jgi:ABC transporter substrate binding protein